ncbi:MAG TPA: TonB-dependent receptor [Longimicrobiales bacterium]|nr:TonB-dependent receptor [Longimicrobiales bacterium]
MSRFRWLGVMLFTLLALPGLAAAQERGSVTGQVVAGDTQQPLQGVDVSIPDLGIGTTTDERGRFLLNNVPFGEHEVQFSYIGYSQAVQTVTVGAQMAPLTVTLQVDALRLDELVVIGYGQERRRNVAGATASIEQTQVDELPITSVNQALQGRLTGVQVVQNSGTPGAAMTVRVRGASSISGGNEPLYVIDGVPMNQGDFSGLTTSFGGQGIDAVSDLNPAEIERIDILKDASAAAIYGSRASNGVVLITTKRGITDRSEITFGGYYGWQSPWRMVDFLNTEQYMDVYNEGLTNRFGPASDYGLDEWYGFEGDGVFDIEVPRGVDTDWLDEVTRTAPMSNMEASVRGGTEAVRYFVSGSLLRQDGIVEPMGYERLNGRLNLDYNPFDRLLLGTNISLARSVTDRARSDNNIYSPWANAIANGPIYPVFNEDGTYFTGTTYLNPVGMAREAEAEERGTRIIGNAFAQYQILDWLSVRGSLGVDNLSMRSRGYDSPAFGPWAANGGQAQAGHTYANKVTYEGTLSFDRGFGDAHDVSGVVGSSYEDNSEEWSWVQGTQFPTEYFKYITSAATIADGSSTRDDNALLSFFGRLSYTYADKITTSFNIRHDGSSRFGSENRFGTFPSASVVYRIGEEDFMLDQDVISDLALRASYGVTGNQQQLGNFAARGLFGGGVNYNDLPGISPEQLANPELKWEKTSQLNLGTDFSLLNRRLGITFDYYQKKTDDLLIARPVPLTTGFEDIWSNVGSMENEGVELAANLLLVQASDPQGFNWSTTLNLSHNRNEVTALYNDQPINSGFASRVEVGKPLGFFYGHKMAGLFQSEAEICRTLAGESIEARNARCAAAGLAYQTSGTAPGDIRFEDVNGDGVINDDDRTDIGSPWPDIEGGITNNISFLGFDVSAFVQFSLGNEVYNAMRIYTDQYGSFEDNHTTRALDRWTPENTDTNEPRAVWGDPNNNTRDSDRFVEDGSYVRLKNLVVGYTLPTSLAGRLGARTARIYFQGQNLLTGTDYSGFDPEVNYAGQTSITRGTDFYTLPQTRTVTIGFNLGF